MKEVASTARNIFLMWQKSEDGNKLSPLVEMVFNHVEREYGIGVDEDGKNRIGSCVKMETTRLWMNRDMVEILRDYCDTILEDIEELEGSVDYDPKQSPEQLKQDTPPPTAPDYSKIDPEPVQAKIEPVAGAEEDIPL